MKLLLLKLRCLLFLPTVQFFSTKMKIIIQIIHFNCDMVIRNLLSHHNKPCQMSLPKTEAREDNAIVFFANKNIFWHK